MSIISVKGPREGEITLHTSPETVVGTFQVGLGAGTLSNKLHVLYRLRVKEASILFSKKYSILGDKHTHDEISMYTQPSLLTSGKISTIRVEYTVLKPEDAAALSKPDVQLDRATCQPFFAQSGSLTYDVACVVSDLPPPPKGKSVADRAPAAPSPSPLTSWPVRVVAVVVAVGLGAAIGVRLHRGSHTK